MKPTPSSGRVEAFGLDPTGTRDSGPAIQAALDAVAAASGGELRLPPGQYRIEETLRIKRPLALRGFASGDVGFGSTELLYVGSGDCLLIASDDGALWSQVSDLVIRCSGDGSSGVRLTARAYLRNVFIHGFPAHGIVIDTTTAGGGGNANCFRIEQCRVTGCGSDGLRVTGADSNAGLIELLDSTGNSGWGVYDTSLTGSTYLACHTASNALGGFRLSNSGPGGMLLNCYSEGDQPPPDVLHPAYVVGGTWGSGVSDAGLPAARTSATGLRLGGGGSTGGALLETPVLLALGATTAPMAPSVSYAFPFIAAPTDVTALPAIAPGAHGQRMTLKNNTLHVLTLHGRGDMPGSGLELSTPLFAMAPNDVLHLIHFSGVWHEEGRVQR